MVRALREEAEVLINRLRGAVRHVTISAGTYTVEVDLEHGGSVAPGPNRAAEHADTTSEAPGGPPAAPFPPDRIAVVAPLVGTFYRAPEPGAKPLVEIGQVVEADDQVGIIEAMKIMNQIVAGRRGRVVEIAAQNGEIVEYEQPLLYLEPIEATT
jgi:acetyl-CoA carboxylase biotin carboxyl carrier protein